VFLDEIGDMDVVAQAKVLRALQSGEISARGKRARDARRRPCAGGHQQGSGKEVERGGFREDLFFRLNVFPSQPLAARARGRHPAARRGLHAGLLEGKRHKGKPMDAEVITRLVARRWPGNIRELKNVVERMAISPVSG